MKPQHLWLLCGLASVSAGCKSLPEDALSVTGSRMNDRAMQSRRYEGTDEVTLLNACAGVLQDLGFIVEESNRSLGVIVGSKMRDAQQPKQQMIALLMAGFTGVYYPSDEKQMFRASVTTLPTGDRGILVRVTFQREVWNDLKMVSTREPLREPEIYQEFFDRLAKSYFLEGHQI